MRLPASWLVILLLVAHGIMAWSVSPRVGVTADEPVHLVSGVYYWKTGDFRFQPENGNLPQRWAALPWVLSGVDVPARSGPAWERADVWGLGYQMLDTAGPNRTKLLAASRGMNVLLGCSLLAIIYVWSAGLWGRSGGLVSLALAAFCPNLLAHAGLATSDTAGTLGFILAALAGWRLCHRLTPARVLMAGAAVGLLAVSKFSVVLFPVIVVGMAGLRMLRAAAFPWAFPGLGSGWLRGRGLRLIALASAWSAAALVAALVIWAAYGFRFAASPDNAGFMKDWETVLIAEPHAVGVPQLGEPLENSQVSLKAGPVQSGVRWMRDHRLLPEAWLYGFSFVVYHSHSRLAFFCGDYSTTGWWSFFPTAWILKSTLPGTMILLLGVGILAQGRAGRRYGYRVAPLILLGVVYGGTSMAGSLNIGLRHWLPLIAAGWVVSGAVVLILCSGRRQGWIAGALLMLVCGHAAASIAARPDYIGYFNQLAGSPAHRHRLFADSNLDWGQGLPVLTDWLREHRKGRPVYLSYFGSDDPGFYDLPGVQRFGDLAFSRRPRPLPTTLGPGLYVFGATQFERVYSVVRGPWTAERERLYQQLLAWFAHNSRKPAGAPLTTTNGRPLSAEEVELALSDFDALTLGRVTHVLQNRAPLAMLSGGILVYELAADDEWWRLNHL